MWPGLVVCLHIFILTVGARHLSAHDDLLADMLVPVNTTRVAQGRVERSAEGSGYDDIHEIKPMPQGVGTFMERLQEALPSSSEKKESMEEMSSVGEGDIETFQDEGSGDYDKTQEEAPKAAAMLEQIEDSFHHEEGMEAVIKDLPGLPDKETTELKRDDENRQENTLSVLASDERPASQTEGGDFERHELAEDKEEGSGIFSPQVEYVSRSGEIDESIVGKLINGETEEEIEDQNKSEDSKYEVGRLIENKSGEKFSVDEKTDSRQDSGKSDEVEVEPIPELEHLKEKKEEVTATEKGDEVEVAPIPKLEHLQEINEEVAITEKSDEVEVAKQEAKEEIAATEQAFEVKMDNDGSIEKFEEPEVIVSVPEISSTPADIEQPNADELPTATPGDSKVAADSEEVTEEAEEATTTPETKLIAEIVEAPTTEALTTESPSTEAPITEAPTVVEPITEAATPEAPITTTSEAPFHAVAPELSTTEAELVASTSSTTEGAVEDLEEIETATEAIETTTEVEAAILIVKEDQEMAGEASTEIPLLQSTTEDSEVEIVNGTILSTAMKEATVNEKSAKQPNIKESSASRSLSMYIIVGILVLCFIVLVAVVTLRNRGRRRKVRMENGQDRDTEKALLGKYKDDSEENNIKNNEIAPLVIKQNSQINKFEKNPNFSSPKNLNTTANEKNIEKDNVLKSTTQAIIEGEVEDAKKTVEDELQEEKKRAVEELAPLAAEKVVVRTHMDLDSIPRKPVLVNRNGHTYHPVPGGETKT